MKPVRTAARVMLSAIFISSGTKVLLDPDSKAETAGRVTERVGPLMERIDPRLPSDTRTLIRLSRYGVHAGLRGAALLAAQELERERAA